ncbi:MAG: adenylyltransferase/cytidyltransferase family protein [Clostridia bacterium]|nr:adenylyltransferase/cytidyltransferase family protein [Clostridia bacterium]
MLGYYFGKFDVLRGKDLQELDEIIQKNKEKGNEHFALAVYDDQLCEALNIGTPLKSIEDRLKIVQELSGVDFAFSIPSKDSKIVVAKAKEAYEKFLGDKEKMNEEQEKPKKYKIGYVPGTYDLFHAGHLENLLEASANCEKLVVGVKSDSLVQEQKKINPTISASERIEILRHFRFVDNVYQFYTRDPHTAMSWIESKYGQPADAMFVGSDLRDDYKRIEDINVVYTNRDLKNMSTRSSSGYRKKLQILGFAADDPNNKYTGPRISVKRNDIEKDEIEGMGYLEV